MFRATKKDARKAEHKVNKLTAQIRKCAHYEKQDELKQRLAHAEMELARMQAFQIRGRGQTRRDGGVCARKSAVRIGAGCLGQCGPELFLERFCGQPVRGSLRTGPVSEQLNPPG